MANLTGFDASQVEPNSFEVIPAGDYPAIIVNSEMKETKKKDGEYLKLEVQIIDGKYKGRKVFDNLNLRNPSATAVQIAQGTLSAICRAVSVMTPGDSAELHNKPMVVALGVANDQNGNPQNVIKAYKKTGSETGPKQSETVADGNGQSKSPFGG